MRVELFRLDGANEGRNLLTATRTNAEGRTDAPLVEEGELSRGVYELVFEVGEYFARQPETGSADPPFLDRVAIRFGVADPTEHSKPRKQPRTPWPGRTSNARDLVDRHGAL